MAKTQVTNVGIADMYYPTNIVYNAAKKSYLLSISKSRHYQIHSIKPEGIIGSRVDSSTFDRYYDYLQVIYDSVNNKQYLCCISTSEKYFELFNIGDDAKLSSTQTHDFIEGFDMSMALFIIGGNFYTYTQYQRDNSWEIIWRNVK